MFKRDFAWRKQSADKAIEQIHGYVEQVTFY